MAGIIGDYLFIIDTVICNLPLVGKDIADSTARVKLKIILLGNSGVGKTSILTQYVTGVRVPDQMYTIGVEFKIKDIEVEGKDVRLALWDTAGLIFSSSFRSNLMQ